MAITHLGGAGVWLALLALAAPGALGAGRTDSGRARRADRFRDQGGLDPAAHVAAARAPRRAAPFSALMSGMMVKVALYGLIRVEFEWLGAPPRWLGLTLLAAGCCRPWAASCGRCCSRTSSGCWPTARSRMSGSRQRASACQSCWPIPRGPRSRSPRRAAAHRQPRGVQGAAVPGRRARSNVRPARLELDRLGGLLRRMPWTGVAFGIGCLAIAGRAAAQRLRVGVADAAVAGSTWPSTGRSAPDWREPWRSPAIAATAALALLCFVKVAGLVLLGPPRAGERAAADGVAASRCAPRWWSSPRSASLWGWRPACSCPRWPASHPAPPRRRRSLALDAAGDRLAAAPALALALVGATALLVRARGRRRAAPAPTWACGQPSTPALALDLGGVHQAAAARARGRVPPAA